MTRKPTGHKGHFRRHWRVWLALINVLLAVLNLSIGHYTTATTCTLAALVLADSARRTQRRPSRRISGRRYRRGGAR